MSTARSWLTAQIFMKYNEALELCVKTSTAKFDETVEVHVKLGVDGRHADQQVRGAIVLPNGTGKICSRSGNLQGRQRRRPLRQQAQTL